MHRSPTRTRFLRSPRANSSRATDDPRAYLERCIATISARDAQVHAFVTLGLENARRAADASAERYRSGKPLSAVDGMPIGVKDIMDTGDLPTQMGNALYKGWQPRWDAACVHALRSGGAIVVGKTVTTAFAGGETNEMPQSARSRGARRAARRAGRRRQSAPAWCPPRSARRRRARRCGRLRIAARSASSPRTARSPCRACTRFH